MFERPVLLNPTRYSVGDQAPWMSVEDISRAVQTNTGNMAFLYAIMKTINGIKPVAERPFAASDVKVWGCANFIAANRDVKINDSPLYTDGIPIVAIGLGAQAPLSATFFDIPANTIEWVRKVRSMAPTNANNISLRGQYTDDILTRSALNEGCEVLGCPSLFIAPDKHLGVRIREKLNRLPRFIGCAPGNPMSLAPKCIEIEQWFVETLRGRGGSYLIQHPIEMLRVALGHSGEQDLASIEPIRAKLAGDMDVETFLRWCKAQARSFHDVPSWMFHTSGLDFVISLRIHGAQMAIQSGTPALCLAIDSRQIELCEVMRMPYLRMSDFDRSMTVEDLYEYVCRHNWDGYDENRRLLAKLYITFLQANRLQPSPHLLALA